MEHLSSQDLIAICESYWADLAAGKFLTKPQITMRYQEYVNAKTALTQRGSEILQWCCKLLIHTDYDARECGAYLLGQLGKRHLLGEAEESVVVELGALTKRPIAEDNKELQAIDSAIIALTIIGNKRAIPFFRNILFSSDKWLSGGTQWTAACELGDLIGEPFKLAAEPIEAARAWLSAHPDI